MKILHIGICSGDNGFTAAMRKVGEYQEVPVVGGNLNERILATEKADLVFIQIQSEGIAHSTIVELKRRGSFIINWTGDVRHVIPAWMHNFGADLTCFSNMNDVDQFGIGADFLQIGYDPSIYTPDGYKASAQEVVFMGNSFSSQFPLSAFRREMVTAIQLHIGRRFGVYGAGWHNGHGNFNQDQLGEAAIYRGAKIGINLSHFDYRRYSSDRIFRLMGSGCFCLTKWYPEIEVDFQDGKHLVVWRTLNELKEKINFYLTHDIERNTIAAAGHDYVRNNFSFDNMAENIIKLYEKWQIKK